MSKMGRWVQARQENALHYWGAMDRARGKALSDFTEEQVDQMGGALASGYAGLNPEASSM